MGPFLGALGSIGTILVGYLAYTVNKRKVANDGPVQEATAAKINVETALSLITSMNARIGQLESDREADRKRIAVLETRDRVKAARIEHLEDGVIVLTEQVHELGDIPRWTPASPNESDTP